ACGSSATPAVADLGVAAADLTESGDLGAGPDGAVSACALADHTSATATVTNGCAVLSRDVSACLAGRQAQGLSGAWLEFSCRVKLSVVAGANAYVLVESDGQPD